MSVKLFFVVVGILCFFIDALKAWLLPTVRINFFSLGWAFIAMAVLLPL